MNHDPIPVTVTLDYAEWLTILDALDEKVADLSDHGHHEMAEEARVIRDKIEVLVDAPA